MSIKFDPGSLTLGEMEDIEKIAGRPISIVFASLSAGEMSASAVAAFIYVVQRRTDPTFTLDDAKAYKMSDVEFEEPTPKD